MSKKTIALIGASVVKVIVALIFIRAVVELTGREVDLNSVDGVLLFLASFIIANTILSINFLCMAIDEYIKSKLSDTASSLINEITVLKEFLKREKDGE